MARIKRSGAYSYRVRCIGLDVTNDFFADLQMRLGTQAHVTECVDVIFGQKLCVFGQKLSVDSVHKIYQNVRGVITFSCREEFSSLKLTLISR